MMLTKLKRLFQVDGDNIIKTIVNEEAVEKATAAQLAAKDEQKVAVSGLAFHRTFSIQI